MKRKRFSAGEIRFRASKNDLDRIDYLLKDQDDASVSALMRRLIAAEVARLKLERKVK